MDLCDGFYLEGWLVKPQFGRLTKGGQVTSLEPKIMRALLLLAENQPDTISKERFLQTVWSDVNVVDNVVARAISQLRSAFGDDPLSPHVIETIPKVGYRLIGEVRRTVDTNCREVGSYRAAVTSDRWMSHPVFIVSGALAIVGILSLVFIFWQNSHGHIHLH
jgi:DNA-binding winged helix-turn-helix (wHTH) protein